MRVRSPESFWLLKSGLIHTYPSLHDSDASAQVVVLGGGVTGALISHALLDHHYDVMLVDRRDIAMGSTAASTCMLQYEIDVPLYRLAERVGEQQAAACYRAGVTAINELAALVEQHNISCGFEKKSSLYMARTAEDSVWLRREFDIRRKHGLEVEWLEASQVFDGYGLICHGAIRSAVAATADSYRLAHGIIAGNCKRGLRVYDQTPVSRYDFDPNGISLQTATGRRIRCEHLIICTGYEAREFLKERTAGLFYTYACVSEPMTNLKPNLADTIVWDTGDPYLYLRTTDDHRLLIGGEDVAWRFSWFQTYLRERKSRNLQEQLKAIMPGVEFIEDFSWGGIFGSTKDGLPYIGASPWHPNTYFVLGYGGNGITFSAQGMQIIPQLMRGEQPALSQLYRFGR